MPLRRNLVGVLLGPPKIKVVPYRGKKVGGKRLIFWASDQNFPRLNFPPTFQHPSKKFTRFFISPSKNFPRFFNPRLKLFPVFFNPRPKLTSDENNDVQTSKTVIVLD